MTSTEPGVPPRSELSRRQQDGDSDLPDGARSTQNEAVPRRTRQRAQIAAVLDATPQWLTARQVHQLLAETHRPVGLATVYRTLTSLAEAGEVDAQRFGVEWAYRRCSAVHHHHLTCRNCGHTVEVAAPDIEAWANGVGETHGYVDIDHVVEITGVCPQCAA